MYLSSLFLYAFDVKLAGGVKITMYEVLLF